MTALAPSEKFYPAGPLRVPELEDPGDVDGAAGVARRSPIPVPAACVEPAPSTRIARAARAHGDSYPVRVAQWQLRLAGLFLIISELIYIPWMVVSLNLRVPWVAWPFAAASAFSLTSMLLTIANNWVRSVPESRIVATGAEPHVAVIVPTCGENIPMILRTVRSVLEQDWPLNRLTVVVSDDGHDPDLEETMRDLPVIYHSPPGRFDPGRDGAAKAGNLNSALTMIDVKHPECRYIETRDADDELGSSSFLRQVVGQLEHDHRVAFVQTVKETQVSAGDPFENLASMFYRGQMLSRHASNAVFPCGSGVVWRRTALRDIGEFPVWNLVEDLQSGVEALRRGWTSVYLPIVGAVGQHCPEDLPNVYKQRGTWAVDTVRLMVWGNLRGLNIRQRLHFTGMLLDYLNSVTVLIYIPCVTCSLFGWQPMTSSGWGYIADMLPLIVAIEAWMLLLGRPYNDRRSRQRTPVKDLWQFRVVWAGMATMITGASLRAFVGGRTRKPEYKVTRKYDDVRWHWREVLPQLIVVSTVVVPLCFAVGFRTLPSLGSILGPLYFGGVYIALILGFITRSWYGVPDRTYVHSKENQ